MKRVLHLALAVAAIAFGWHWWQARADARFGATPEAPLGDFRKLDPWLTGEGGFTKAEGAPEGFLLPDAAAAARCYRYVDAAHDSPSHPERVVVALDAGGRIVALAAQCAAGAGFTAAAAFLAGRWESVFGSKPAATAGRAERLGRPSVSARWTDDGHFATVLIWVH